MRIKASRLVWEETSPREFTATGARGTYALSWFGSGWKLTGNGHDGLVMMVLAPAGRTFSDREKAELHADWIECHGAEGEISGAG